MPTPILPYPEITPIPNNEPNASPSLWNARYSQQTQNFKALEKAVNEGIEIPQESLDQAISYSLAAIQPSVASAHSAAEDAKLARDAALIQAGVYVDEPTGRAAVADGQAFKVQGSGTVAAYEYRRTNSGTSALISTYPSKAAYDTVSERQKLKADLVVGKNLFNPADPDVVLGSFVDKNNGNLTVNAAYNTTGYIPVVAGLTYALTYVNQLAWYNTSKVYISGNAGVTAAQTAPAGAVYLRVMVATGAAWNAFQVEVGSVSSAYKAYALTIPPAQLPDGGVSESRMAANAVGYRHTKFLQPVKNLFNAIDPDVALGYYVDANTGTLTALATYNTTGYIPITGGASYRLSYGNQIAWYDVSKNYISGQSGLGGSAATVVAPSAAVYLRRCICGRWFQLEAGQRSKWKPALFQQDTSHLS